VLAKSNVDVNLPAGMGILAGDDRQYFSNDSFPSCNVACSQSTLGNVAYFDEQQYCRNL